MGANAELVTQFYQAFQKRDGQTMAGFYAPDALFSDPGFPKLSGYEAGMMWRMLCEGGKDLRLEFSEIQELGPDVVTAHWEAWYTFGATGQKVHNQIDATITIKDGKFIKHVDSFDFYRWSKQAFGPVGLALGWTPILPIVVQKLAGEALKKYIKKRG